jgi:Leucine-rich repeat (LRR) protein
MRARRATGIHLATAQRYPDSMAATDSIIPEPRRFPIRLPRPLWLGLAAFFIIVASVVLRVGLPIYWQHVVLKEIERLGGTVVTMPGGPDWLRGRIDDDGMEPFDTVTEIEIPDSQASDATLRNMGSLARLERLRLDKTNVTDAGMVHLSGLTNLRDLWLDNTQVTDIGLSRLKGLTGLEMLAIGNTKVTDAGLVYLERLDKLEWLGLNGTEITDAGLVHLYGLTNLKRLWLINTRVTGAGIAELQRALPNISLQL